MTTLVEIETAIARLPSPQVAELAAWLEQHRRERAEIAPVNEWLQNARGASLPQVTTQDILTITRGES